MNNYKIFKHPQGRIEAVKEGWSWPAFFFGSIWAIFKRMWAIGIGLFAGIWLVSIILNEVLPSLPWWQAVIFEVLISGGFGQAGNQLRENHLLSRGYDWIGSVTASNPEGALAVYLRDGDQKETLPEKVSTKEEELDIDIIDEPPPKRVHVQCSSCGLDRWVERSKFGDRNGTVRMRCPQCRDVITLTLAS